MLDRMNPDASNDQTRSSLLRRVRDPSDERAWEQFHDLYSPLMYQYAVSRGLQPADAEEVRSECLMTMARQISAFRYERSRGAFRSWLRTIVVRRVIDQFRRKGRPVTGLESPEAVPDESDRPDELWEQMWRENHLQHCMSQVQPLVSAVTWEIFESLVDERETVDELCQRLQISRNQAYKARSRVLALIREKMKYLDPDATTDP